MSEDKLSAHAKQRFVDGLYHYTESGLSNVWLHGIQPLEDHAGRVTIRIKNLPGLHREIARAIVFERHGMRGEELRFLRTEMAMTQAELGSHVHRDAQTIGRWERGEIEIDSTAEALIRLLTVNELGLTLQESVSEVAARSVSTKKESWRIDIDGENPSNYRYIERKKAA